MRLAFSIVVATTLLLIAAVPGVAQQGARERFAGKLLVADVTMPDPRFAESVIYLVRHDGDGAFGLIINKPLVKLPLAEMLRELDLGAVETEAEVELYFGGPVQGDLGFVLHSPEFTVSEATMAVEDGFSVSSVRQVLRAISEQKGPKKAIFAVGYAGWAPEQLDAELARGDWNIIEADEALIFDLPVSEKWPTAHDRRSLKL